jgi:hypothetical protein
MADYTAPRYWAVRYFAVRYWSGSATPGGPQYVDAAFEATSASVLVATAVVQQPPSQDVGGGRGFGFDYIRPRRYVDARLVATSASFMTATATVQLGRGRRARRREEETLLLLAA